MQFLHVLNAITDPLQNLSYKTVHSFRNTPISIKFNVLALIFILHFSSQNNSLNARLIRLVK